jgi:hypothetical protein
MPLLLGPLLVLETIVIVEKQEVKPGQILVTPSTVALLNLSQY